jgi:hypothetical protein
MRRVLALLRDVRAEKCALEGVAARARKRARRVLARCRRGLALLSSSPLRAGALVATLVALHLIARSACSCVVGGAFTLDEKALVRLVGFLL